jgi:hypothetical protein
MCRDEQNALADRYRDKALRLLRAWLVTRPTPEAERFWMGRGRTTGERIMRLLRAEAALRA